MQVNGGRVIYYRAGNPRHWHGYVLSNVYGRPRYQERGSKDPSNKKLLPSVKRRVRPLYTARTGRPSFVRGRRGAPDDHHEAWGLTLDTVAPLEPELVIL